MTDQATDIAVRRSITVEASQQRAFAVFTEGFDRWWPRTHHIGAVPMREAVMEPAGGGRWYERGEDGSECEWGRVLAWEPPSRLVVSWHLNAEYRYDPDPARASEVEVRFIPEGPGRTRVELAHLHLERHGDGAETMRNAVDTPDGGWGGLLRLYAAAVAD